jgi:hypothetical protein
VEVNLDHQSREHFNCINIHLLMQETSSSTQQEDENRPFPYYLPMDPMQQTLSSIPLVLFYPAILACIGGAGFAGLTVGRALPGVLVHRALILVTQSDL